MSLKYKESKMFEHEEWSIPYLKERHVLEDPELHEKTIIVDGMLEGTGELDDPHCDWCWDTWPCSVIRLIRMYESLHADYVELKWRMDGLKR